MKLKWAMREWRGSRVGKAHVVACQGLNLDNIAICGTQVGREGVVVAVDQPCPTCRKCLAELDRLGQRREE